VSVPVEAFWPRSKERPERRCCARSSAAAESRAATAVAATAAEAAASDEEKEDETATAMVLTVPPALAATATPGGVPNAADATPLAPLPLPPLPLLSPLPPLLLWPTEALAGAADVPVAAEAGVRESGAPVPVHAWTNPAAAV
jgi:hypothetical protein